MQDAKNSNADPRHPVPCPEQTRDVKPSMLHMLVLMVCSSNVCFMHMICIYHISKGYASCRQPLDADWGLVTSRLVAWLDREHTGQASGLSERIEEIRSRSKMCLSRDQLLAQNVEAVLAVTVKLAGDRRLGGESNREIVSCRTCVRAQSVSLVRSRPQIRMPSPSLFPFGPRAFPSPL